MAQGNQQAQKDFGSVQEGQKKIDAGHRIMAAGEKKIEAGGNKTEGEKQIEAGIRVVQAGQMALQGAPQKQGKGEQPQMGN